MHVAQIIAIDDVGIIVDWEEPNTITFSIINNCLDNFTISHVKSCWHINI
jgi:hypothetical protein